MALARYESVAVNTAGDVIPNATVEVRRDQPGRPVVPLFSDREGTIPLGNPIATDSEGKFAFHAPGGVYYIRVFTGPSQQPLQQYVRRYQAIGTAAERDVEDMASALEAGTATFPTLADLQGFTPSASEGIGGKVTTGAGAGFYHYDPLLAEGSRWVFDRPLYDTLARMTVTGGTANAIDAAIDDGIVEAAVIAFMIKPTLTNTGPLTINGKAVLNINGDPMSAGEFPAGRWITFTDEGANYQLVSDPAIDALLAQAITLAGETQGFRDEAEVFRNEAAASAAGVNLPPIELSDAGKQLFVRADETGYEFGGYEAGDGIAIDASTSASPVVSISDGTRIAASLVALQVSDNSNAALFLGNGIADAFDDLTYVDVAGATNLSTATAGVLKPTIGADTFASSGSLGLTTNFTAYGGYSTRERVPVGVIVGDGNAVRLTLRPPTSGNNTPIDDVWIGHAGTGADFDGSQVRVTFGGGATGVTLTAGGSTVVSDLISFPFDDTKDLIVAFDFGATADVRGRNGLTGYTSYQKAATSGESGTTTVSGYTPNADMVVAIDTIEVRTAMGTPNNMTVLSTILTAPIIPDVLTAILLVKEVGGASVAGTDYTFRCSRDGGATFATMTLTEKFTLPNGLTVVEAAVLDVTGQPSANNPRWRFDTLNNKNIELHGVHFVWPRGSSP